MESRSRNRSKARTLTATKNLRCSRSAWSATGSLKSLPCSRRQIRKETNFAKDTKFAALSFQLLLRPAILLQNTGLRSVNSCVGIVQRWSENLVLYIQPSLSFQGIRCISLSVWECLDVFSFGLDTNLDFLINVDVLYLSLLQRIWTCLSPGVVGWLQELLSRTAEVITRQRQVIWKGWRVAQRHVFIGLWFRISRKWETHRNTWVLWLGWEARWFHHVRVFCCSFQSIVMNHPQSGVVTSVSLPEKELRCSLPRTMQHGIQMQNDEHEMHRSVLVLKLDRWNWRDLVVSNFAWNSWAQHDLCTTFHDLSRSMSPWAYLMKGKALARYWNLRYE